MSVDALVVIEQHGLPTEMPLRISKAQDDSNQEVSRSNLRPQTETCLICNATRSELDKQMRQVQLRTNRRLQRFRCITRKSASGDLDHYESLSKASQVVKKTRRAGPSNLGSAECQPIRVATPAAVGTSSFSTAERNGIQRLLLRETLDLVTLVQLTISGS